jgi:FO synthase
MTTGRPLSQIVRERASGARAIDDTEALSLICEPCESNVDMLTRAARAVADRAFGSTLTYSPKVFLPVTNLCRNLCEYCSFRRSPSQQGVWTMSPSELTEWMVRGREQGCVEALLCLGDKPETAFPSYRRQLAEWGHEDTVGYLVRASEIAIDLGLLPHTNAGLLTREDMSRLRPLNVSLGLMLESASARLCEPGMPHHRAPDKHPSKRLAMMDVAGDLRIPFTTGILVGIGETRAERVDALLHIRRLHERHGHIQEVIVQSFRTRPEVPMHDAPEPSSAELSEAIALARLILEDRVTVQAPPNLSPTDTAMLIASGINDFGGISPVTPDYINPRHPWPHLDALGESCARHGYSLTPRLPIHTYWRARSEFFDPKLEAPMRACEARTMASSRAAARPSPTEVAPCAR